MYTLLLRLSAPLQSWGSASLFDTRETDYMPTKSGVLGIIAAALGRKRNEPLDDLMELKYGVRVDLQGTKLNDFQITHMGEKYKLNVSNRAYLSDAIFLVGLQHENKEFLEKIIFALNNPIYSLFLGRRSCPPTQPLVLGIRSNDLYSSLYDEEWLVPNWRRKSLFKFSEQLYLRIVIDNVHVQGGAIKKDVPLSYSPFKREYGYRYIKEMQGKIIFKEQVLTITQHDPMSELR